MDLMAATTAALKVPPRDQLALRHCRMHWIGIGCVAVGLAGTHWEAVVVAGAMVLRLELELHHRSRPNPCLQLYQKECAWASEAPPGLLVSVIG